MGVCQSNRKGNAAAGVCEPTSIMDPLPPTLLGRAEDAPPAPEEKSAAGYRKIRNKRLTNSGVEDIDQDVIVQPTGRHTHTVILLHGLYGDGHDFTQAHSLTGMPAAVANLQVAGTEGIKYIFPSAPKRTMHWPSGDEKNVGAWYTYYSDKSGENPGADDDKISVAQFNYETQKLIDLVAAEVAELGDSKNVIIGGNSQGGTVAINAGVSSHWPSGCGVPAALLCLRTCPMQITLQNLNTSPESLQLQIFAFIDGLDDVYPVLLQQEDYGKIETAGYQLQGSVIPGVTHERNSQEEEDYAAKHIVKTFFPTRSLEANVAIDYDVKPPQALSNVWWKCC